MISKTQAMTQNSPGVKCWHGRPRAVLHSDQHRLQSWHGTAAGHNWGWVRPGLKKKVFGVLVWDSLFFATLFLGESAKKCDALFSGRVLIISFGQVLAPPCGFKSVFSWAKEERGVVVTYLRFILSCYKIKCCHSHHQICHSCLSEGHLMFTVVVIARFLSAWNCFSWHFEMVAP